MMLESLIIEKFFVLLGNNSGRKFIEDFTHIQEEEILTDNYVFKFDCSELFGFIRVLLDDS